MAVRSGAPDGYPGRPEKKQRPEKVGAAFYAVRPNGAFLARRRPPRGLLASTMELPGGAWRIGALASVTAAEAPFPGEWAALPAAVEHVFTHFTLHLRLFAADARCVDPPEGFVWIAPDEIGASGFSGLMRKAAEQAASAWRELRMRSGGPSTRVRS